MTCEDDALYADAVSSSAGDEEPTLSITPPDTMHMYRAASAMEPATSPLSNDSNSTKGGGEQQHSSSAVMAARSGSPPFGTPLAMPSSRRLKKYNTGGGGATRMSVGSVARRDVLCDALHSNPSTTARASRWIAATQLPRLLQQHSGEYVELVSRVNEVPDDIKSLVHLDVERTISGEGRTMTFKCPQRACLTQILHAFAVYCPSLSYQQGMSYLANAILSVIPNPEEAFWLFERVVQGCGIWMVYDSEAFEDVCEAFKSCLPRQILDHLEKSNVPLVTYLPSWLRPVYSHSFDVNVCLRVLDLLLLCEADLFIHIRVAVAILNLYKSRLLSCGSLDKILPLLLHEIPNTMNENDLLTALMCGDAFYLHQALPPLMRITLAKASATASSATTTAKKRREGKSDKGYKKEAKQKAPEKAGGALVGWRHWANRWKTSPSDEIA